MSPVYAHGSQDNSPIKQLSPATTVAWLNCARKWIDLNPFPVSSELLLPQQDELWSGVHTWGELITKPKLTCRDIVTWHASVVPPTHTYWKLTKHDIFWFKDLNFKKDNKIKKVPFDILNLYFTLIRQKKRAKKNLISLVKCEYYIPNIEKCSKISSVDINDHNDCFCHMEHAQ